MANPYGEMFEILVKRIKEKRFCKFIVGEQYGRGDFFLFSNLVIFRG